MTRPEGRPPEHESLMVGTIYMATQLSDGRASGDSSMPERQAWLEERFEAIRGLGEQALIGALETIAAIRVTPKEELEQALGGNHLPYADALALEAHWHRACCRVEDEVVHGLLQKWGAASLIGPSSAPDTMTGRARARHQANIRLRQLFDDLQFPREIDRLDLGPYQGGLIL